MGVDETIDRTKTWLFDGPSPFASIMLAVLGFGFLLSVFDLLKKTVFLNANWNYTYQYWNFVYNYFALGALLVVLGAIVVTMPWWLEWSSRQFAVGLFLTTAVVFTLGLFALPLELTKALDVDKRGLYNGAVYLVNHGPIDFLRSFHSLPQTAPEHEELYIWDFNPGPEQAGANRFAEWMRGLDWVPFNEGLADYVDAYTAQKHGPVAVLFVAPFLLLFGTSTAAALAGNVAIACLIPVVGYYTFRLHFSELLSRLGAALVAIAPGLFIWTRHAAPVPYDIVTALLVACSLYVFLKAIETERPLYYALTGVFVSLAGLTKLTGLLILLPITILLIRNSDGLESFGRRMGMVFGSWFIVPVLFLLAGYNFVAQYLFTVYKLTIDKLRHSDSGGRPSGNPAEVMNNDVVGLFGTLYNGRWMNVILLAFVGVFVGYLLWDRSTLSKEETVIGAALLTSFLPFAVWILFAAGTLSRHTVVLVIPFGFVSLAGLSLVIERSEAVSESVLIRFGQLAVLLSAAQLVINI